MCHINLRHCYSAAAASILVDFDHFWPSGLTFYTCPRKKILLDMVYICPGGNCTGIAIFFLTKCHIWNTLMYIYFYNRKLYWGEDMFPCVHKNLHPRGKGYFSGKGLFPRELWHSKAFFSRGKKRNWLRVALSSRVLFKCQEAIVCVIAWSQN